MLLPETIRSVLTYIQRYALLNSWKTFEYTVGSPEHIDKIEKQMPRRVKKRRKLQDDQYEEYTHYVFCCQSFSSAGKGTPMEAAEPVLSLW